MEVTMAQSNSAAAKPKDQPSGDPARKPVDKFHEGPVHVSIWENKGPKSAFRIASFELRYRDKEQQWQTAHSYGVSDLKYLENAAREARTRIEEWQNTSKAEQRTGPG
jgi:hypothetical protein